MKITEKVTSAVKENREKRSGRSFYLYDLEVMHQKIDYLKSIMPPQVQLFYAMKANPHPAFLSCALNAGVAGIEIASLGEGQKSIEAHFQPNQIIFTGPGKSPEELEWSVKNGIRTVHIESLTEAYRLNAVAEKYGRIQDILIRLNPDFDIHDAQANFSGGSKKMGIDAEKLDTYLPRILDLPHLRFRGLHVYAASGVLNVNDLLTNCTLVFQLAKHIEDNNAQVRCDIIDFGGGFGIDYLESGRDFSPEEYVKGLTRLIVEYGFEDRSFVLELGRYLTADSGWYCTEILDIKDSRGTKQIVTAGGTNHFRRPAALSINHPVVIVPMNVPALFDGQERVHQEKVYIGGPLCNSADKIANQVYVEHAEIGDMVVLCLAGAYGLSMSHTDFLSHAKPEEMLI
jgi:2-[(L-alanin-3-ylcarbamoyl)methyl]-2-hydroxybutanedioate decarboxylase